MFTLERVISPDRLMELLSKEFLNDPLINSSDVRTAGVGGLLLQQDETWYAETCSRRAWPPKETKSIPGLLGSGDLPLYIRVVSTSPVPVKTSTHE